MFPINKSRLTDALYSMLTSVGAPSFFNFIKKKLWHRCFTVGKFWRTSACGCFSADFRKWLVGTLFLGSLSKPSWLGNITKIPIAFKPELEAHLAQMLFLYLSPILSFELRFRMIMINGYYTKSKRLQKQSPWNRCIGFFLLYN